MEVDRGEPTEKNEQPKEPDKPEDIVQVVVMQRDQFDAETRVICPDSNGFGVSENGALLVGYLEASIDGPELHPLHAWASHRWVKADVEVIKQKTPAEAAEAGADVE